MYLLQFRNNCSINHKCLENLHVFFSSAENIAVFIWESLVKLLPNASLHEIKLHETDKNIVYFKGEYAS